jgi:hypothetical protein
MYKMSTLEVAPETVASSHPIDAYYDQIFTETPQGETYPYDEKSGLYVWFDSDEIRINDPNEKAYRFSVHREYTNQNVLALSICNDIRGNIHPLLYPSRLLARAIPLLERSGNVDAVMGYWLAPPVRSDNYRNYVEGLDRLAPNRIPTEEDCAKAASGTWTGKQLSRLGYSAVQGVEVKDSDAIQAFFTRPS